MRNPWDEDWYPDFGDDEDDPLVRRAGDNNIQAAWIENEQRAKLLASAPDLVRALLAVEWIGPVAHKRCSNCGASDIRGHYDECDLAAALRKAGVIE